MGTRLEELISAIYKRLDRQGQHDQYDQGMLDALSYVEGNGDYPFEEI